MSTWSKRFWSGGRYSPFGPPATGSPPTVSEEDYHYLGPDDIVDPPRSHRTNDGYGFPLPRNATRSDAVNQHSPDILVLKHRGTTYPLHLPAFSIAEGDFKVGELRRLAAKETKTEDSRRVKLLYKGKILKDDNRACREEGLKQNSELMCVISEAGHLGSREDLESSDSADSEEMLENDIEGPRIEVDGTIRGADTRTKRKGHRGGRRKKPSNRDGSLGPSNTTTPRESGFLSPQDPIPPRSTSPAPRAVSPSRHQPNPNAQQAPLPTSPPRPKTPFETLEAISQTFHNTIVPKCLHFTNQPPSDPKVRDLEYKKLSETILAQCILKTDAVETDGDEGLRAKRKQLVRETQEMLAELDKVMKAAR
ncbi:hypothetical protein MMC07_002985 [Pseudocyphellaria aurata]|nr:hypothetical protein [Pseudocyphellaria aurata]